MKGVFVRTVQPGSSLSSACALDYPGRPVPGLLVNLRQQLQLWDWHEEDVSLQQTFSSFQCSDHFIKLDGPHRSSSFFLATLNHGNEVCLLQMEDRQFVFRQRLKVLSNLGPQRFSPNQRFMGCVLSSPCRLSSHNDNLTILSITNTQDTLSVVSVRWTPDPVLHCKAFHVRDLLTQWMQGQGELDPLGTVITVVSMAFYPQIAASPANKAQLAILSSHQGYAGNVTHAWCCEYEINSSQFSPGAWFLRNMHPSTSLLHPVRINNIPNVAIISTSIIILPPRAARRPHTSLPCSLRGLPTCAEQLPGAARILIGDDAGTLCIVDLHQSCCQVVLTSMDLPPLRQLCFLRGWAPEDTGSPGAVLCVSGSGPSVLLRVPRDETWVDDERGGVQQWEAMQPPLVPSLSPVHDAVPLHSETVSGSSEMSLLVCGGTFRAGSVSVSRLSCAVEAVHTEPTLMEGNPGIIAVRLHEADVHHSALLFSYEAACCSSVLRVDGEVWREGRVEGMVTNSTTLQMSPVPNNFLVQVTPQVVAVMHSDTVSGSTSSWTPPHGAISVAHVGAGRVALSCINSVYCLEVHPVSGLIQLCASFQNEHQVSALHVFKAFECTWLALGQWESNCVELRLWDAVQEMVCRVTVPSGQPRSVCYADLTNGSHVCVGTSDGLVGCWRMRAGGVDGMEGAAGVALDGVCVARVGESGVDVMAVEGTGGPEDHYVVGRAEECIILRHRAEGDARDFEAVRLHGIEGAVSLMPVSTPELPHGMCWISPQQHMMVGTLNTAARMHWYSRVLPQELPQKVALFSSLPLAVALTTDEAGASRLRLLRLPYLQQVGTMDLGSDHHHTAVCITHLPSTSSRQAGGTNGGPAALREFIVLSSYTHTTEGTPGQLEGRLSVLEVVPQHLDTGSKRMRYQCVVHGTIPLGVVCYSLLTMTAQRPAWPVGAAQHSMAGESCQLVVAGCVDGVDVLQLFVDDTGQYTQHMTQQAISDITDVPPLPPAHPGEISDERMSDAEAGPGPSTSSAAAAQEGAGVGCREGSWVDGDEDMSGGSSSNGDDDNDDGGGAAAARSESDGDPGVPLRGWFGHVNVSRLGKKVRGAVRGVVSHLQRYDDSTVIAGELLGSISVYRLVPLYCPAEDTCPELCPMGGDNTQWTLMLCSVDRSPVFVQCCAAMPPYILSCPHPCGLALMYRDSPAEDSVAERLSLQAQEQADCGGVLLPKEVLKSSDSTAHWHPAVWHAMRGSADELPPLQVVDANRFPQLVVAMLPGHLGITLGPMGHSDETPGARRLVLVSNTGGVAVAQPLEDNVLGTLLSALRRCGSSSAHTAAAAASPPPGCVGFGWRPVALDYLWSELQEVDGDMSQESVSYLVDGDLLRCHLAAQDDQQLALECGLPLRMVQRARHILQSM